MSHGRRADRGDRAHVSLAGATWTFGAWIRAQVCIHTYSTFVTVANGAERRTGVSPGEAAHHCSALGRRISLANIIGKCTKEVLTGNDSHRVLGENEGSCPSDGLTPCLPVCAGQQRRAGFSYFCCKYSSSTRGNHPASSDQKRRQRRIRSRPSK